MQRFVSQRTENWARNIFSYYMEKKVSKRDVMA